MSILKSVLHNRRAYLV